MPCEHYKDSLAEAAASGAEPQGELRAHLAACASCRAALAEEQSLFASIDAGLHATANAEVPPSLLPRVRAALQEQAMARQSWLSNPFVLATAAAMVLALSVSLAIRQRGPGKSLESTVATTSRPAPLPLAPQIQAPSPSPQANSHSGPFPRAAMASARAPGKNAASSRTWPEVLVPSDQQFLLTRYAEQWRGRKRAPLLAEDSQATTLVPMEVAPIQIDQLDVKLLAEEKSQ